ncbi:hypothetical protein INT45_002451, partial [Circinella minor]
MIFSHRTVKSFRLSVSPGGTERLVAFGPGAVVSGSVFLTLEKPLQAYNIKVIFRCEQKSNRSTNAIFNVESIIWGKPRSESTTSELKEGCHMYLFAIKLPNVNYPPSIHDNDLGYRVDYTLQGFLNLHDQRVMETAPVRIMYLPFISCVTNDVAPKRTQSFKRGNHNTLQLTLQTSKAAYCPGDRCTIRLNMKNRSEHKISSYQVALVAMTTITGEKSHTVHSETIYSPVAKYGINTSVCHFQIPSHCTPSLGIYYQIMITLPWGTSSWKFPSSSSFNSNVNISVPITIATVPVTYRVPPHLRLPLPSYLNNGSNTTLLPSFIPNIESPEPSPSSPVSIDIHSPSPSLSLTPDEDDNHSLDGRTLCDGWPGNPYNTHQYSSPSANSGFLTVPSSSIHHQQQHNYHQYQHNRRLSTSSILTDCAELNSVISDSSSHTRVAV